METLPKLTSKQYEFVRQLGCNGGNLAEAYRNSYDAKGMKAETIYREAQSVAKNPKVSAWIEYMKKQAQKVAVEELNYTITDCFKELDQLKNLSLEARSTFGVAKGCIELKGKLAGHFNNKDNEVQAGSITVMGDVTIDGKTLAFEVGEDSDNVN